MSAGIKYWGEGDWESPHEGVELAVFNRMAREGLPSQVTFAQKLEGRKRGKLCGYGGRTLLVRTKFL